MPPQPCGVVFPFVDSSDIVQKSAVLLEKALFISGRDKNSVSSFSYILGSRNNTVVQPEEVVLVTDPILSDSKFSDTDGKCWRQSEGATCQYLL